MNAKRQSFPFIATRSLADQWGAWFGVRLASIGQRPNDAASGYSEAQRAAQIRFISVVPAVGTAGSLELRIASHPDIGRPQAGTIEVALRCRTSASSAEDARAASRRAFQAVWPSLVAMSEDLAWDPVDSREEYQRIFALPTRPVVTELVRREALIIPTRAAVLRHSPMGFLIAEGDCSRSRGAAEPSIHTVFPFAHVTAAMDELFEALLVSRSAAAISVRLAPAHASAEEHRFLADQIEQCERYMQMPMDGPVSQPSDFLPIQHFELQHILDDLVRARGVLRDDAFVVQVSAVTSGTGDDGIVHALGAAITRPVGMSDPAASEEPSRLWRGGGFDWHRATSAEMARNALENVELLDTVAWAPSLAPTCPRLRYLMDASQANAAFQLPVPAIGEFPGVETRFYRTRPAPREVSEHGTRIGTNMHRGTATPVALTRDDRRRHMFVVGQTGTGKSNLLLNLILQDIEAGDGACLIDPHGDLAQAVLERVPKNRAGDVMYFSPEREETRIALNLLEAEDDIDREYAVNSLIEIFDRLYDLKEVGGPMFELMLRMGARLAFSQVDPPATLSDLQRVFLDKAFRDRLLETTPDKDQRSFWKDSFEKWTGDWNASQMSAYVVSKFTRLLQNRLVAPIVTQPRSSIDFRKLMDERGVLIVNLNKGRLGSFNCNFLGMIVVNLLSRAAFSRQAVPQAERRDFYLYIDEFQNIATESFAELLSEARKYRCNLILANQYLDQVPKRILQAVIGNVGTTIAFRLGQLDAEIMEEQFAPSISRRDLISLPNFVAYVRTLVAGEALNPFDVRPIRNAAVPDREVVRQIIQQARSRFRREPPAGAAETRP